MPTIRHALLVSLLLILPILSQAEGQIHREYSQIYLHPRADNSTEIQATAKNKSTSTFVTALWTNAAIFGAQIIAFSLLRLRFKAIYEPRTYVPQDEKKRSPSLGKIWEWPFVVLKADFGKVLYQNGVDAYLFVRFHRMMALIFFPIWVISWAVLMPVTDVESGGDNTGLDRFTFGNIGKRDQVRYWAHLGCAWVFTAWICGVIYYELLHFIETRQDYLTNDKHAKSPQANTVLITGVDDDYLSTRRLRELFSTLPGGVRRIWINRDLDDLPKIYERRLKACSILEKAETKLIQTAMKIYLKEKEGSAKGKKRRRKDLDKERVLSYAEEIVPEKDRPKRLLPLGPLPFGIPLLSKKVDTIDWARGEILDTTKLMNEEQEKLKHGKRRRDRKESEKDDYPLLNSVFIHFNEQIAAHLAIQALMHHEPFKMSRKYIEVAPADVIWSNLGKKSREIRVRTAIGYAITVALIVLWSVPVAAIGATSNIASLCKTYSWLSWLCDVPHVVVGLIQGVLPAVLLTILMKLLPKILRSLSRFEGVPRRQAMELSLMTRYFAFLVIHTFLIVTLSSGLVAALPELLQNPTSIPALLAQELPKASNFFLTYVILQGLTGTGMGFLQIGYFIIYYLKLSMAGSTPRSLYNVKYRLKNAKLGELFPESTVLAVISIAYMVISPIINGLATATFFFFYEMYKYRFLYQLGQPAYTDTGGLFFPRAIQHIFAGVYIQQICLCSLFFLARNQDKEPSGTVQGILMIVLIVFTVLYHNALNRAYNPLIRALPLSRAGGRPESHARQLERRKTWLGGEKPKFEPNVDNRPPKFNHPALGDIRPIWIPSDHKPGPGVADDEVDENERLGITSGCKNAKMNEKGKVEVFGHPPEGEGVVW